MTAPSPPLTPAAIEAHLQDLFIAAEGTMLRKEDRKKAKAGVVTGLDG